MYDHANYTANGDYVIEVYGRQWWWEVHYKEPNEVATVVTANEIRVPIGKKVQIKLYSNNVIHSFYVPQLSGKMDVMPGHINTSGSRRIMSEPISVNARSSAATRMPGCVSR